MERRNLRAWDLGVLERSSRRGLKQVAEDDFCVPFLTIYSLEVSDGWSWQGGLNPQLVAAAAFESSNMNWFYS